MVPFPRRLSLSGGRAGAANVSTPPLRGPARSVSNPGKTRWPCPSPRRPRTASHRAHPPGRLRSGFVAVGSPTTRATRARARSGRPRSGSRWASCRSKGLEDRPQRGFEFAKSSIIHPLPVRRLGNRPRTGNRWRRDCPGMRRQCSCLHNPPPIGSSLRRDDIGLHRPKCVNS